MGIGFAHLNHGGPLEMGAKMKMISGKDNSGIRMQTVEGLLLGFYCVSCHF